MDDNKEEKVAIAYALCSLCIACLFTAYINLLISDKPQENRINQVQRLQESRFYWKDHEAEICYMTQDKSNTMVPCSDKVMSLIVNKPEK